MRIALFVLLIIVAPVAYGREWSVAAGKFEGEFEACDVIVRLPNGERVSIPISDLSASDQTFVLGELRRAGRDAGPNVLPEVAKTLEGNVATLRQQIATQAPSGEIKNTLNAIRTADPAFKRLEPIVKELLDSGEPPAIMSGLTILGEFKIADVWLIEKLLSLEQEFAHDLPTPANGYLFNAFPIHFFDDGEYAKLMNYTVQPYRRIVGLLAGLVDRDPRVKRLFTDRITSLQSGPEPEMRAAAAVGLSGAKAMDTTVVPLLVNAMKKDASPAVQVAAGFSLGGFDGNANGVAQSLIDAVERPEANAFYLSALIDSSSDSPLLRKVIKRMFEAYRSHRDHGPNFVGHACAVLRRGESESIWAIPELINCCQVALGRRDGEFDVIGKTLLTVGRTDQRVLKFFEKAAREGPDWARVTCDTAAKQIAANIRAAK